MILNYGPLLKLGAWLQIFISSRNR